MVHAHIRNMSMADIIPRQRISIVGANEQNVHGEIIGNEKEKKQDSGDLIKERSPLADMLYLRCELFFEVRGGNKLMWVGLDGLKIKWPGS